MKILVIKSYFGHDIFRRIEMSISAVVRLRGFSPTFCAFNMMPTHLRTHRSVWFNGSLRPNAEKQMQNREEFTVPRNGGETVVSVVWRTDWCKF